MAFKPISSLQRERLLRVYPVVGWLAFFLGLTSSIATLVISAMIFVSGEIVREPRGSPMFMALHRWLMEHPLLLQMSFLPVEMAMAWSGWYLTKRRLWAAKVLVLVAWIMIFFQLIFGLLNLDRRLARVAASEVGVTAYRVKAVSLFGNLGGTLVFVAILGAAIYVLTHYAVRKDLS